MVKAQLKLYGVVAGIFVLGAGAGAGAGYAVANQRIAEVLEDERPGVREAWRLDALSSELDLTGEQRSRIRGIMERHRDDNRKLMRAMFEKCGDDLRGLRDQVEAEIRGVLQEGQKQRFDELMEKRGRRFPLGGPGPRRRKGDRHRD